MTTAHKHSLAVLLSLFLGACGLDNGATPQQVSETNSSEWEWVNVAGYFGVVGDGGTLDVLFDALEREGIRWVSAGSAGFCLGIDSRDLPRGREIVRQVVERYNLQVGMIDEEDAVAAQSGDATDRASPAADHPNRQVEGGVDNMIEPWSDPLDPVVITVSEVATGQRPAMRVRHSYGPGGWQFYDDAPLRSREPVVVLKDEILALDDSLRQVTDLPVGWEAVRESTQGPWTRRMDTDPE